MGKQCSKCRCHTNARRNITLLMLGLDNAGKTTTARHYLGKSTEDIVPTVGFSTLTFQHKRYRVEVYDLGGSNNIRGIWKNYYALVHGIIFVIDSTDKDRLEECKVVLRALLNDPRVSKKPILLLVNKQDKEGALNEVELCGIIEIESLVNEQECPTRVETTVASVQIKKQKDKGIQKGFDWLLGLIIGRFDVLDKRVEGESYEQREAEERERAQRMERVRKLREERESKESLPNEVEDLSDVIQEQNGNPFRPINELSAEALVRDLSERKFSAGGPRNPSVIEESPNSNNNVNVGEKDSSKKRKKHFRNKVSPVEQVSSTCVSPSKTNELPPIRSASVTPQDSWAQKPHAEIVHNGGSQNVAPIN